MPHKGNRSNIVLEQPPGMLTLRKLQCDHKGLEQCLVAELQISSPRLGPREHDTYAVREEKSVSLLEARPQSYLRYWERNTDR